MKPKYYFWLFLLAITALRLKVSGQFGLTVDEAHYVLYGKFLDWSYFDHPPLIGWTHALFQLLNIDHLIKARLPALLISLLTSHLIYRYLIGKRIPENISAWAVIALNITPMFNAMSIALLPDSLLMPLTLLIISTTENLQKESSLKNWVLLGFWLGLAGLAKYTAVLYVIALVLIFIYKKKLRELINFRLWIGVLIAAALVSPVLYWNFKNHWISFKYQGNHVFHFDASMLENLGTSFLIQLISWGIGPVLISLFYIYKMLRNFKSELNQHLNLIFLSVFFVFFSYIALSSPLLPHWMLIFFIVVIPLSYAKFLSEKKFFKTLIVSVTISALLTSALLFELGYKIFPPKYTANLYEGVIGWNYIMEEANKRLAPLSNPKKALAVMNWTLGSRAMYYNNKDSKVFVIDDRFDQFDIWAPESYKGYDLIVIIEANKKEEHLSHLTCASITAVGTLKMTIKDIPVNHFLYYYCADFSGYKQ